MASNIDIWAMSDAEKRALFPVGTKLRGSFGGEPIELTVTQAWDFQRVLSRADGSDFCRAGVSEIVFNGWRQV